MKRTIANTPLGCLQIHTNEYLGVYALANISDEARVHFLHKPYANDFKQCREAVMEMKDERRRRKYAEKELDFACSTEQQEV